MPIQADMPFHLVGRTIDAKQNFKTKAEMKACPEDDLSDTAMCTCDEDGILYVYNKNNEVNPETGKWEPVKGGTVDEDTINKLIKENVENNKTKEMNTDTSIYEIGDINYNDGSLDDSRTQRLRTKDFVSKDIDRLELMSDSYTLGIRVYDLEGNFIQSESSNKYIFNHDGYKYKFVIVKNNNTAITLEEGLTAVSLCHYGLDIETEIIEIKHKENTMYVYVDDDSLTKISLKINDTAKEFIVNDKEAIIPLDSVIKVENANQVNITRCVVYNPTSLVLLNLSYTDINDLRLFGCDNLQYLYLFDTPIASDKEELLKISNSLVDRNDMALGSIIVGSSDTDKNENIKLLTKEIESEFIKKEWYFGSSLYFTDYDRIPKQIKNSGVLNIWESADYGEGCVVATIDVGFTPNLGNGEVPLSKWVAPINLSTQAGTEDDPMPLPTDSSVGINIINHGNISQSLIISYPISSTGGLFGVSPKAKMIPIKVGDETASGITLKILTNSIRHVLDNKENVVSVGYSGEYYIYDPYYNKHAKDFIRAIKELKDDTEICVLSPTSNSGNDYTAMLSPFSSMKDIGFSIGGVFDDGTIWEGTSRALRLEVLTYSKSLAYRSYDGAVKTGSGTSQACAFINGCMPLVENLLSKKLGRKPSREEKYAFIVKHTHSISGDRDLVGNGIFNFMQYNENASLTTEYVDYEAML